MNMNRRQLSASLLLAGIAGATAWPVRVAAQGAGPVEGRDFTRVEPARRLIGARVIVVAL